jgi:hypothetical protein
VEESHDSPKRFGKEAGLAKTHILPAFLFRVVVPLIFKLRTISSFACQFIPSRTELLRYRSRPIVCRMSLFKASPSL